MKKIKVFLLSVLPFVAQLAVAQTEVYVKEELTELPATLLGVNPDLRAGRIAAVTWDGSDLRVDGELIYTESDFAGWDMDASDDFGGDWSELTGTPPPVSTFNNDAGYEQNVQADWDETDPAADAFILNKPTLAAVATSGDYNDLLNQPNLSQYENIWGRFTNNRIFYVAGDVGIGTITPVTDLTIFDGTGNTELRLNGTTEKNQFFQVFTGNTQHFFAGRYGTESTIQVFNTQMAGKSTFSANTDLLIGSQKRLIFGANGERIVDLSNEDGKHLRLYGMLRQEVRPLYNQSNEVAVWGGTTGDILGTRTIAAVALSGDYNDLLNQPDFTGWDMNASDDFGGDWSDLTGTPPPVSTFNNDAGYEQNVQADWDETDPAADAFILNKPALAAVALSGDYNDLLNQPNLSQYENIWQKVGDGRIYYNTDKVGIGTDNPDFQLTTTEDVKINGVRIGRGANANSVGSTVGVFGNTFIGEATANTVTTGYLNTAVGWKTGDAITTGNTNTLIGSSAGQDLNTGFSNTFIGNSAGSFVTAGKFNTVVGYSSSPMQNSNNNIIVGNSAVGIEGDDNIIIGNYITLFGNPKSQSLQIGDIIYGTEITSSNNSQPSGGNIGINVFEPQFNFHTVGTVGFENLTQAATTKLLYFNETTNEVSFADVPADVTTYWTANGNNIQNTNAGRVDIKSPTTIGTDYTAFPSSSLNIGTGLIITNTGANQPYFQFYNAEAGTNQKWWRYGAVNGDFQIETVNDAYNAASLKMKITNAGSVGIGTPTPFFKLHVNGTVGFENLNEATADKMLYYNSTTDEVSYENGPTLTPDYSIPAFGKINLSSGGGFAIRGGTHIKLNFESVNGRPTFSVDTYHTPFSKKYTDLIFDGTSGLSDGIDNVDDADASTTNEVQTFSHSGNRSSLSLNGGYIEIVEGNNVTVTPDGSGRYTISSNVLNFWTAQAGTQNVYNNNLGNVGIGTDSPTFKLDVNGRGRFVGLDLNAIDSGIAIPFDGGDAMISIHDGHGNFNIKSGLDDNNTIVKQNGGSHIQMSETGTIALLSYTGNIGETAVLNRALKVNGTGIFFESDFNHVQGNLYTDGNIGVGTTNPAEKLHVAGQVVIDGTSPSSAAYILNTPDFVRIDHDTGHAGSYLDISAPNPANGGYVELAAGTGETWRWEDETMYFSSAAGSRAPFSGRGGIRYNHNLGKYQAYDHASSSWKNLAFE